MAIPGTTSQYSGVSFAVLALKSFTPIFRTQVIHTQMMYFSITINFTFYKHSKLVYKYLGNNNALIK